MITGQRRRNYIPLPEKLASALACLLPQEVRDDLRRRKVPAQEVISIFEIDHVQHHSLDGVDSWWNLDPRIKADHQEKTRKIDIPAIAKVKRNEKKWGQFMSAIGSGTKPEKRQPKSKWPKRSFGIQNGRIRNKGASFGSSQ